MIFPLYQIFHRLLHRLYSHIFQHSCFFSPFPRRGPTLHPLVITHYICFNIYIYSFWTVTLMYSFFPTILFQFFLISCGFLTLPSSHFSLLLSYYSHLYFLMIFYFPTFFTPAILVIISLHYPYITMVRFVPCFVPFIIPVNALVFLCFLSFCF